MQYGYSSHGKCCKLDEILELELERENESTINEINQFIAKYPERIKSSAIWVTEDAFLCFKNYILPASYFHKDDDYLKNKFPNWESNIHTIPLQDMILVCQDYQGGYLYCYK